LTLFPTFSLPVLLAEYPHAKFEIKCPHINQWYNDIFSGFKRQAGYDVVMLDSQWIGEAVSRGYVSEVTDVVAQLGTFL